MKTCEVSDTCVKSYYWITEGDPKLTIVLGHYRFVCKYREEC